MFTPILLANSTGTLIEDIANVSTEAIERRRPGMLADLKEDKERYFDEYIWLVDSIILNGEYDANPVNGAEKLPVTAGPRKIGLFAAASQGFLRAAYELNGLGSFLTHYFSICDDELRGDKPVGRKDHATYARVAELLQGEFLNPIAYISHKPGEAQAGAEVYGNGILIAQPGVEAPTPASGSIHVVPSLASPEFRHVLDAIDPLD